MPNKSPLLFIPFLLLNFQALAQKTSRLDSLAISYSLMPAYDQLVSDTIPVDTSLNYLVNYQKYQAGNAFIARGNNKGTALYPLFFTLNHEPGVPYLDAPISSCLLKASNYPFLHNKVPYTHALYSMGSGNEQIFSFTHAQSIGALDAGFTYRILSTTGTYLYQKARHDIWGLSLKTNPKLKRFKSAFVFTNNKIALQENGGIQSMADFTDSTYLNRQLIDVNLTSATNTWRVGNIQLNASYDLIRSADSSKMNLLVLYSFDRSRSSRLYIDENPQSGFYSQILGDSSKAFDSTCVHSTTQFLGVESRFGNINTLRLKAGLIQQYLDAWVTDSAFALSSLGVNTQAHWTLGKHTVASGLAYYFTGADRGSGTAGVSYRFLMNASGGVEFGFAAYSIVQPAPLQFRFYSGNFSRWSGGINPQRSEYLSASAGLAGWELAFALVRVSDFIFLDKNLNPVNFGSPLKIQQLTLSKNLIFDWLTIENDFRLQLSSADSVASLPSVLSYQHIHARFPMFENALNAQVGLEFRYISGFHPSEYRPDISAFRPQSEFRAKSYPYLDAYIGVKIQHARIFIKSEHVNSGLLGNNYFLLPSYPMSDRNFVFGVDWTFYD